MYTSCIHISCSIVALAYQLVVLLHVRVSIGKKNLSDSGTVMFCFGQTTKDPLHKVSLPNLFGNQDKASLWSTSLINIFRLPSVHQQDAHEEHHLQQLHQSQLWSLIFLWGKLMEVLFSFSGWVHITTKCWLGLTGVCLLTVETWAPFFFLDFCPSILMGSTSLPWTGQLFLHWLDRH